MEVIKNYLGLAALILSIMNGLILIQNYLNNKPKIKLESNGDDMMWWTKLPTMYEGSNEVITYGFFVYAHIQNRGIKRVKISKWWIKVKDVANNYRTLNRLPIPICEEKLRDGSIRLFPVLGNTNKTLSGNTMIEQGDGISGFAFYADQQYSQEGSEVYILNEKNEMKVRFYVKDGYGKTRSKYFNLKYVDFSSIENIMPGIDKAMFREKKII